jgi:hypothetical protein
MDRAWLPVGLSRFVRALFVAKLLCMAPRLVSATPAVPPRADQIEWAGEAGWPLAVPRKGPVLAVVGKDDNIVVNRSADGRAAYVERVRFHRTALWRHPLPEEFENEAALLIFGDRVFVAYYCAISSGARLFALDLQTGKERFVTQLAALGPIAHSKYSNHVTLKIQDGFIVVFGNEAFGRYIEVVDPGSGKTLSNRKLESARP